MNIHYYLTIFPLESLVASELDPETFGVYMATASHRGSSEPHVFIEVAASSLGSAFDVAYAEQKCRGEPDRKKNSVYLSIYRTLEHLPLESLGQLYLVTRDGRALGLEPERLEGTTPTTKPFYLYQELCPMRPVVVTTMAPTQFCQYMTSEDTKTHVPRLAFADLRVIDLDQLDDAGNIGNLYHQNLMHLRDCIEDVGGSPERKAKTLDRARVESFTYNLIDTGVYVGDEQGVLYYRMKSPRELNMHHHAWARSAMIV